MISDIVYINSPPYEYYLDYTYPQTKKEPTHCSYYVPILSINTDLKICSKALALRLEFVISSLVHLDQTGFVKGRHSSENMQRLFNIIHLYKTKTAAMIKHPAIILTLDAEKEFDWVGRPFLFRTLNHFGFTPYFNQLD